jgi:hypothetical protein
LTGHSTGVIHDKGKAGENRPDASYHSLLLLLSPCIASTCLKRRATPQLKGSPVIVMLSYPPCSQRLLLVKQISLQLEPNRSLVSHLSGPTFVETSTSYFACFLKIPICQNIKIKVRSDVPTEIGLELYLISTITRIHVERRSARNR